MTSRIFAATLALGQVLALGMAAPFAAFAQPSSVTPKTYPVVQGKTYKFEKIAEGVYYATGGFGSNNVVVVNDQDGGHLVSASRVRPRADRS